MKSSFNSALAEIFICYLNQCSGLTGMTSLWNSPWCVELHVKPTLSLTQIFYVDWCCSTVWFISLC